MITDKSLYQAMAAPAIVDPRNAEAVSIDFCSLPLFFPSSSLFVRLINHRPAVLFSQNKSATSNQPAVLFSQNKSAPAISHQPNEQVVELRVCAGVGSLNATNRDCDIGGIRNSGTPWMLILVVVPQCLTDCSLNAV
jgi:hypothetical protein